MNTLEEIELIVVADRAFTRDGTGQATKSHRDLILFRKTLARLPSQNQSPPLNDLLVLSYRDGTNWTTRIYDRRNPTLKSKRSSRFSLTHAIHRSPKNRRSRLPRPPLSSIDSRGANEDTAGTLWKADFFPMLSAIRD
jgi:hypothetical protein